MVDAKEVYILTVNLHHWDDELEGWKDDNLFPDHWVVETFYNMEEALASYWNYRNEKDVRDIALSCPIKSMSYPSLAITDSFKFVENHD